jgi:hypothetical protein
LGHWVIHNPVNVRFAHWSVYRIPDSEVFYMIPLNYELATMTWAIADEHLDKTLIEYVTGEDPNEQATIIKFRKWATESIREHNLLRDKDLER